MKKGRDSESSLLVVYTRRAYTKARRDPPDRHGLGLRGPAQMKKRARARHDSIALVDIAELYAEVDANDIASHRRRSTCEAIVYSTPSPH
jgi:hypothetical protein